MWLNIGQSLTSRTITFTDDNIRTSRMKQKQRLHRFDSITVCHLFDADIHTRQHFNSYLFSYFGRTLVLPRMPPDSMDQPLYTHSSERFFRVLVQCRYITAIAI